MHRRDGRDRRPAGRSHQREVEGLDVGSDQGVAEAREPGRRADERPEVARNGRPECRDVGAHGIVHRRVAGREDRRIVEEAVEQHGHLVSLAHSPDVHDWA
jgi:hypothetical protein